jgi:putative DNA primase/helicase
MTINPDDVVDYIQEEIEKVKPKSRANKAKAEKPGDGKLVVLDPAKYDDRRAGQDQRHEQREQCDHEDERKGERILVLPAPTEPMAVARVFASGCLVDGELTLRHWRGGWWSWKTMHWIEVDERTVRSILYRFTEHAVFVKKENICEWAPTRRKVADLIDALAAICLTAANVDQPAWLDGREAEAVVSVGNGLLEINTSRLIDHDPRFFNQTTVPFDYDARAPQPERWLQFLDELWPDEPEAIEVLQQWFGYVISGRTDLHKILLMVGPTRGGKGAIARILTALIGRMNVAGPTLNSLAGNFGLAPLIGKPLAVISDARFAGRDASVVVERLLSISGEDTLTVDRKYRDQWTGKLPSRLHVLSNELPKLGDASTAIVGRIVLLLLSRSWLNKEDHGLEPALRAELPGILNWALTGLSELIANNNAFTRLASAEEAIIAMRDLASPVAAFVREQCQLGPDCRIAVDSLYGAFKSWAEDNGHSKRSKQTFGRDLRAAYPSIQKIRSREGEERYHEYVGINTRT